MAALEELAQWEADVYQIELTDPVVGGPDGISNRQAKQLGNRTQWLKAQLQQLLADLDGLQPLDATLTALAGLQTVADQLIYTTGPDAFATSALTALARQLLAAGDQVEVRTVLEAAPLDSPAFTGTPQVPTPAVGDSSLLAANTAFVQAAIAALVNSSPAALDTLNELAAALGNDPNFATTVMNAIAGRQAASAILTALAGLQTAADQLIYTTGPGAFATSSLTALARQLLASADQSAARSALGAAPLDSPTFTGAPKAPTALPGTNTTQLANTAFVQAAIAALVNSSPAALDTLNELAAALGNDPNFATTMTNALAGKQPLLGFTPVQQGTGAGQGTNAIKIGWGAGSQLLLQVDTTNFSNNWPISVGGTSAGLSGDGPRRLCTAWVNFNGSGTLTIRDSYNVTSITDVAVGRYRVNFNSPMANANYAVSPGMAGGTSGGICGIFLTGTMGAGASDKTVTGFEISTRAGDSSLADTVDVNLSVFGGK